VVNQIVNSDISPIPENNIKVPFRHGECKYFLIIPHAKKG
jgi:hypothetical protein